jgi:carbamoyl-phosphate synthase small subunit
VHGARLVERVSTPRRYVRSAVGERRFRVAAVDLGIKSNTLRSMAAHGLETHVLPASCALDDVLAIEPDGVFLSNGPGDPAEMTGVIGLTRQLLACRIPLFGICFGHQILGLALGRETYKMRYGHRGINVPVVDSVTGRAAITAHNHGFAVRGEPGERLDSEVGPVMVSHHCPNDGTVEGLRCASVPAFSVQFHPEAAAGPHDAMTMFGDFVALMNEAR